MKYFLLGSFSLGLLSCFGIAMLYGYSGSVSLASIASNGRRPANGSDTLLFGRDRADRRRAAVQGRRRAVSKSWKPDVYQGAPDPRSPAR